MSWNVSLRLRQSKIQVAKRRGIRLILIPTSSSPRTPNEPSELPNTSRVWPTPLPWKARGRRWGPCHLTRASTRGQQQGNQLHNTVSTFDRTCSSFDQKRRGSVGVLEPGQHGGWQRYGVAWVMTLEESLVTWRKRAQDCYVRVVPLRRLAPSVNTITSCSLSGTSPFCFEVGSSVVWANYRPAYFIPIYWKLPCHAARCLALRGRRT